MTTMNMLLLPLVHKDTIHAVDAALRGKTENSKLEALLENVRWENPEVEKVIKQWAEACELKGDAYFATLYCGALVYALLKNQSEADELESTMPPLY